MRKLQKAILQTLAYADVFDYPLSVSEVWRYLIASMKAGEKDVQKELTRMSADLRIIDADKDFYFLRGQGKIVALRRKRERGSQKKMRVARKVAGWLKLIPTIKMVAVTGALAMENSEEKDDIDLLIVTAQNRLWLTRGLIVTILRFSRTYRRPDRIKDMICPNMLLDEEHLMVPKKEQDLFSAHEVCQLKPLWERDDTYQKFIKANLWVKKFLANWKP